MKISVVIIAFNEEDKIGKALDSVQWADEIIVVDSESTDQTVNLAQEKSAKVITQKWLGFSKQKQFAADSAENDWILSLDADEVISEELKNEIIKLKELDSDNLADGYKIPRLAFYMNQPIRHGGWYPDWQLRFFNRQKGKWNGNLIHESVKVEGKVEKLKGEILHFSFENVLHHHQLIGERYAPLAARQMFEKGLKTTPLKVFTAGFFTFFQTYFLKLGFMDGLPGFAIARFAAHHTFLKYLHLWELQNKKIKTSQSL